MLKKILKNRNILIIVLSILIFNILFISRSLFYVIDKNIQNNYYYVKKAFQSNVSSNILVVKIDEETLLELWRFPFDREVYVQFLDNLKEYSIATIWFDIIFLDKTNEKSDTAFIEKINTTKKLVFWSSVLEDGTIEEPFFNHKDSWAFLNGYLPPILDVSNRYVYSFFPLQIVNWINYEHFTIKILRTFYSYLYDDKFIDYQKTWLIDDRYFHFDNNKEIPLSHIYQNDILINYVSPENFQEVSFIDIYDKDKLKQIAKRIDFTDKILLIWTTASWLKDVFYTPNGEEPGVYIHANILNTILTNNYIVYFNRTLEWILIFFLISLSIYFNFSKSSFIVLLSNIIIFSLFLVIFPIYIIVFTNIIINFPTEIILSLLLSLIISNIVKYIIEDKNKEKLNTALSEYVWKDIAFEVLSWEWKVNLSWEKKEVIILFSDIKSFTTISENFSPEEVVFFLREYLKEMTEIIVKYNWFIDKYEWDSIMALWGVFWELWSIDFINACDSLIDQQKKLIELNEKWKKELGIEIYTRIWMHFWDVIVWNIWSKWTKISFTALGNNVNIASRLDWVNKFFGTNMIVSKDMYEKTKTNFVYRCLWKVVLKWKAKYTKIYELMWRKGEISFDKWQIIIDFWEALTYFTKWDIKTALKIFTTLSKKGDNPSIYYKKECNKLLISSLPSNWKWIINMDEK